MEYKIVLYDKIDLITPDKYNDLLEDLSKRIGIKIEKVEIDKIDFLRNSVILKVFYRPIPKSAYVNDYVTPVSEEV